MAVSNQDIVNFLKANPNMSDANIASAMKQYGISPEQMAQAVGIPVGQVTARLAATIPSSQAVLFGDTYVQPIYSQLGSGEDAQQGPLQNVVVYKEGENKVGGNVQWYSPTGEFQQTTKQQEVNATKDFLKFAALTAGGLYGLNGGFEGLFGGGGGAADALTTGAADAATTAGVTGAESLGTGVTGMGAGTGITGTAGSLTGAAGLEGALGTGITGGATGLTGAAGLGTDVLGTGLTVGGGLTGTGLLSGSTLGAELLGTGTGLAGLTGTGILTGSDLGTGLLGTTSTTGLTGTGVLTGSDLGTELLGTGSKTASTVGGVTGLVDAANVGTGALDTGVTTGITGLGSGGVTTGVTGEGSTGVTTTGTTTTTGTGTTGTGTGTTGTGTGTTGTGTTITDGLTSTLGGLTTAQLLDLLKSGISLGALTGLLSSLKGGTGTTTTGTGTTTPVIPSQSAPSNTQNYYNAIQQSYNQMMPGAPRDVMTPLQQWYSGEFSPSAGYSVSSLFRNELPAQQATSVAVPTPTYTQVPRNVPVEATVQAPIPIPQTQPAIGYGVGASSEPISTPKPQYSTAPLSTQGMMSGNEMTPQAQVAALLNNPNLQNLPESASAAISKAINSPRSYQDVINSGSVNKVDLSTLTPEQRNAYDVYQQSQVLGVPRPVAEAAYAAAGVDPTNPSAFFDQLGLQTGMPTKEALARYAPLALSEFGKTGGGSLTFTIDPNTLPEGYKPPTDVNTYSSFEANRLRSSFDNILNDYSNSIKSIYPNDPTMQQQLIDAQAAKLNDVYSNKIRY